MEITLDRYYNRSETPSFSNYKEILFRAGDSLQSAEINELQDDIKGDLRTLSNKFYENGSIVSGIDINIERTHITGDTDVTLDITNSVGVVFAEGEYLNIPENALQILNADLESEDTYVLGVAIKTEEITEVEDDTLLDPAIGTRNFGLPGAGRLKISGRLTLDSDVAAEETFYELYSIQHGEIVIPTLAPDPSLYTYIKKFAEDTVATYDRNSNGNYLVRGYETTFLEKNPHTQVATSNLGPFWFNIADGSANVNGYNFDFDQSRFLEISELVDFELKQYEPVNFTTDGFYELRHNPIRKAFRVTGPRAEVNIAIVHGNYAGASDEMPAQYQPMLSISKIVQGGTTFVQGTDYALNGDIIDWLSGGNEPSPSSTYYVDFMYEYTEESPNFTSSGGYTMGDISPDYKKIYLHGFANGQSVQIDYDFVLDRIDSIIIDSLGNISYIKGVASEDNPKVPRNDEVLTLKIAEVLLQGDKDPEVTLSSNRVFKMSDIQLILDSVKDNSYNISRISLEQDLMKKQPGAHWRDQFVDNFNDDNLRDMGLDNDAITSGGSLELNVEWTTEIGNYVDPDGSLDKVSVELGNTKNPIPILSQIHYTKHRKINSYLHKFPPVASIKITPAIYRWIDRTTYINITRNVRHAAAYRWGWGWSWWWRSWWWGWRWGWGPRNSWSRQNLFSTSSSSEKITEIRDIVDVPQIDLKVESNYGAFDTNEIVDIKMDELSCGTLTCDNNGTLNGSFIVPVGTKSGSKNVIVKGQETGVTGKALFEAVPLQLTVTTTITNHWRWLVVRRWWWWWWDPIAQTFTVNQDTPVNSLEVIFKNGSTSKVVCAIAETANGYPNSEKILTSCEVEPGDLVSGDVDKHEFVFDDKILLTTDKEYAFIIANNDSDTDIQVAKMGQKTIDEPKKWLTDPAYQRGVLFASSNNSAWTAFQDEDVRFWLYGCTFDSHKKANYSGYNVASMTDFIVMTNSKVYENTSVKYTVTLVDRVPTTTVPNEFVVNAGEQNLCIQPYTGAVEIKADIYSEDGLRSPVLDLDIALGVGVLDQQSAYTSIGFEVDQNDKEITAYLDCHEPAGTAINVQAQVVDPNNQSVSWVNMVRDEIAPIGNEFNEIKFLLDLQPSGAHLIDVNQTETRIKISMTTTDNVARPTVANLRVNTVKI